MAELKQYMMYIDGEWLQSASGETFQSINPYTGKAWAEVPSGNAADIDRSVEAARRAFRSVWRDMLGKERSALLHDLADLIEENVDHLGEIETTDNGKLIREMRGQVASLPDYYRYWAGWADKIHGEVIPLDKPNIFHYTLREPLGVIGCIVPWNSPLLLLTWKAAPALALGNTLVIKPAEQTPISTLEFAKLVEQAGFPRGVFNVVTGFGETAGAALVNHPRVSKVAFTGGAQTGVTVAQNAAKHLTPISLELGGKSPNIVFEDADLDNAIKGVMAGIFAASGQTCIAGSRLLVQESIADSFLDRLAERARMIKLGNPLLMETEMGPVCFPEQLEKIRKYVNIAVEEDAKVLVGGKSPEDTSLAQGYFFEPTILTEVSNDMRVAREEIFGPVLAAIRFRDEDEAVQIANDSEYGLAAGIWTSDMARAHRMASQMESGIVWINTYRAASYAAPWGGYKKSGYGRELSVEAIHEYTQIKSVWVELSGEIADPFVVR